MRLISASVAGRLSHSQLRGRLLARRLAGCFLFVAAATYFIGPAPEANLIWLPNGVLLAYLLLVPRKHWPAYLCAGFIAIFSVGILAGQHHVFGALILCLLNVLESLACALLVRRRSSSQPDFTSPVYILRFIVYGGIIGPAIRGALNVVTSPIWYAVFPLWHPHAPGIEYLKLFIADALGICVATPACVAILRSRFHGSLYSLKHWAWLLPVVVCAFAVFSQSRFPAAFLLYPLLVLVLLRLNLGWASLATLFVAVIGGWYTVKGHGPFAVYGHLAPLVSSSMIQLFIAVAMAILYSVSFVLESLRSAERRLEKIARLHALLSEHSRDVIIITDFDGRRSYVSSAGSVHSGWSHEELLQQDAIDMVHPEDQAIMVGKVESLRAGALDATAECRVRNKDGSYRWMEIRLRSIHDPKTDEPAEILSIARDISQRKLTEMRLREAYSALEKLAITDGLTGLTNRRHFDQCLATEWRRALRDRKPLSILLIDADLFKSYNDTYGHLRGDSCLKQVAEAAQDVVARPGDLVARFGGEEFAVILPNTNANGALQLARDICAVMRNRELPHASNPAGIVTVSVGCATLIPQLGKHAASLVDCADQALYQAKRAGRNRACAYRPDTQSETTGNESASLAATKST